MRYLSLFSGIEAATAAWASLGWECVAVSEIDPFACAVLAHHHPGVPNLGDITKITETDILMLGGIDLVVFGSPCQNLSVAGKREGLNGSRSKLFFDALQILGWARTWGGCRFGVWENVPGAFSSNQGADFAVVVGQMAGVECPEVPHKGWGTEGAIVGTEAMVEWAVLDAQWFGVAQRRRRVFAVADFGDWASRPPILLEPESLRGDTAPRRETGQSVARSTAPGAGVGCEQHTSTCGGIGDYSSSSSSNALRASGADLGLGCEVLIAGLQRPVLSPVQQPYAAGNPLTARMAKGINSTLDEGQTPVLVPFDTTQITSASNYSRPKDGDPCHPLAAGAHPPAIAFHHNAQACQLPSEGRDTSVSDPLTCSQQAAVAYGFQPRIARNGRGDMGDVVSALNAQSGETGKGDAAPCVAYTTKLHNTASNQAGKLYAEYTTALDRSSPPPALLTAMAVRRLTPVECERLQAFPDGHTAITVRGKPAADGPRYKALGNSMCVNVMAWIGKQIDHVTLFY